MARDLSRPPAGWSNREGKGTLKAWRALSPGYRAQVVRSRERGYAGSVWEMTKARAAGKLSPTDQAIRAEQRTERNRYVTPLGQGRWNFYARVASDDDGSPNLAGRRALQRNVERAARLGNRNLTAKLVDVNGMTATVGGRGGVSAQYVLDEGEGSALRGFAAILNRGFGVSGGSLDTIATVSLYVFPVERRAAA